MTGLWRSQRAAKEKIAVVGAGGIMGFAMARNLARAGFEVRSWNRSREKAEPLAGERALVVDTSAEAADGATLIVTMLADAHAVIDSMQGARGVLSSRPADDVVWLQMSTIGEAGTERCIELAPDRGLEFVDAPVLGPRRRPSRASW